MDSIILVVLILILLMLLIIAWKIHLGSVMKEDLEDFQLNFQKILNENLSSQESTSFYNQLKFSNERNKIEYDSPFSKLAFEDAFDVEKLSGELKKSSLLAFNKELASKLGLNHKSPLLVEAIEISKNGKIVWKLSKEGQQLLETGQKTLLFDKGGKLIRTSSSASKSSIIDKIKAIHIISQTKLAILAKLGNMIVDVAHFISGTDIVNRLKLMEKKIDFLSQGRKMDKISKLKANYRLAREILNSPVGDIERCEIKRLHKELMELRENWKLEIEMGLEKINDPNSFGPIKKLITRQKNQDHNVFTKVTEFEEELLILDFILIYDLALCNSINHDFFLIEDIKSLELVRDKFKDRLSYISGRYPEYNFENYIGYLDNLIKKYSSFLPRETSILTSGEKIK